MNTSLIFQCFRCQKSVLNMTMRSVHSKRMIKKMKWFRAKKEKKSLKVREPNPPEPMWNVKELNELPNGWTPPPQSIPKNYPFAVLRSKAEWLPVYTRYRQGHPFTLVRHVIGDVDAFAKELHHITDTEPIKRLGTIEIKGNHVRHVRRWLTHLGF
mmetsp:Transcript_1400/g.1826  ORF Transcript_1400/g.1826 Transcript_1400/m.1826 type:complete len:156 (+) Transcript_1400:54-521(+)